jgi:hypothetical protein
MMLAGLIHPKLGSDLPQVTIPFDDGFVNLPLARLDILDDLGHDLILDADVRFGLDDMEIIVARHDLEADLT